VKSFSISKPLATVHEHLTNLERKGYITRQYNESRSIQVLPPRGTAPATEVPLLGKVAAGMPIESLMHDETIAVPEEMLPRRGPNYALQVQGQSMVDEHIVDGDYVVVHGRQSAQEKWSSPSSMAARPRSRSSIVSPAAGSDCSRPMAL